MQIALNPTSAPAGSFSGNALAEIAGQSSDTPLTHYQIIRRNGAVVPFEP
jgi:ribonucleoside-diphosphate reductase alpha chain